MSSYPKPTPYLESLGGWRPKDSTSSKQQRKKKLSAGKRKKSTSDSESTAEKRSSKTPKTNEAPNTIKSSAASEERVIRILAEQTAWNSKHEEQTKEAAETMKAMFVTVKSLTEQLQEVDTRSKKQVGQIEDLDTKILRMRDEVSRLAGSIHAASAEPLPSKPRPSLPTAVVPHETSKQPTDEIPAPPKKQRLAKKKGSSVPQVHGDETNGVLAASVPAPTILEPPKVSDQPQKEAKKKLEAMRHDISDEKSKSKVLSSIAETALGAWTDAATLASSTQIGVPVVSLRDAEAVRHLSAGGNDAQGAAPANPTQRKRAKTSKKPEKEAALVEAPARVPPLGSLDLDEKLDYGASPF